MARPTFVKKARRAVPDAGIKVGDPYWWWKFRFGGKHFSKAQPRPSQLTQSVYYSTAYWIQETIEDTTPDEDMPGVVESVIEEIHALGESQVDNRDNMPGSLQNAETGELLERRSEAMEEWASELEGIDMVLPTFEPVHGLVIPERDAEGRTEAEAEEAWWDERLCEAQAVEPEIE